MTKWVWLVPLAMACGSEDQEPVTCPVCEETSFTCVSPVPNQETATLTITSRQTGMCSGTLHYSNVVIQCESQLLCPDGNCMPYTFDGSLLEVEYPTGTVRCGAVP